MFAVFFTQVIVFFQNILYILYKKVFFFVTVKKITTPGDARAQPMPTADPN